MQSKRRMIGCWIAAMVLLLLISSCSAKKKTVTPITHVDFQWMTAKMEMDITAPGMQMDNISGTLRMRCDSTIWISTTALMGMESLRALITQDSVIVVNRLEQTYLAEPLDSVAEKLNMPRTLLEAQAILVGNGISDHVEMRFGPYFAKIRYTDIRWNEPTTFPIKINKKYERMKL